MSRMRTLCEGNFAGRYQRESRKGCTRAMPSRRLYELVPLHSAFSTIAPNCFARFHLTHVALECRVNARIEKQRQVPTYARKTTVCFLAEKLNAVLFSLKHTGIPCHEIAVQLQNTPYRNCERFLLRKTTREIYS